jgi:protein-tyrosine phosphatase
LLHESTINPVKGQEVIDLHCHILPGLDDGAKDWDQSIEMARIAEEDGISGIVCTPHSSPLFPENRRVTILGAVEELQIRLQEANIRLDIYPGCELSILPNLPARIESGELLSINDSRKIALVEMPTDLISYNLGKFFWTMRIKGIETVLAHPERNCHLVKNPSMLLEWIDAGLMVQITASSISGYHGHAIRDFSLELLRHRMVHFVSTDSHGPGARAPVLSEARAVTEAISGREEAHRIFCEYPAQVLRGEVPDVTPAVPFDKTTPLLRRIFPSR